ncbi:MAG: MFS transporter [Frankia sp.]|nr:MFS transporter [Frankia sp.]
MNLRGHQEGGTTIGNGAPDAGRRRRAGGGRWTATGVFFLNGLILTTYLARVPTLKADLELSNGQVGVISVGYAALALAAMQTVGHLVAWVGARTVLRVALASMAVLLAAVGSMPSFLWLLVGVGLLGAAHGITDVAMNGYAVNVERAMRRPILNGCHAAWSLSGVTSALTTAGLAMADVSADVHLAVAGAVLLVAGFAVGALLAETGELTSDGQASAERPALAGADDRGGRRAEPARPTRERTGWRTGWTRQLVMLGLVGLTLMVCEGAAVGWGAIYLHEVRDTSLSFAAAAVTAFTAAQTTVRLLGDRLTMRFGPQPLFRASGLVSLAGLTVFVLVPAPLGATAGFAVMGLGGAVLIPLTFSAVGRVNVPGVEPAVLMSRFTTFTYSGILVGPAVIGWLSELIGLTPTLAALIPLLALVTLRTRLPTGSASTTAATAPDPPAAAPDPADASPLCATPEPGQA